MFLPRVYRVMAIGSPFAMCGIVVALRKVGSFVTLGSFRASSAA
jgi:hypothetical protein